MTLQHTTIGEQSIPQTLRIKHKDFLSKLPHISADLCIHYRVTYHMVSGSLYYIKTDSTHLLGMIVYLYTNKRSFLVSVSFIMYLTEHKQIW